MTNELIIYADASRGIYIPQFFAESSVDDWTIEAADREILLAGPEHPLYWDVWSDVLEYASFVDSDGREWRLYQDGDLFAYTGEFPESFW